MPTPEEASAGAASSSTSSSNAPEGLSCGACRSRKLKCDRVKPVCTRCAKVDAECIYPESRRKPAFKRGNVRELEARLAQVEGMLKDAGRQPIFAPPPTATKTVAEDAVPRSNPVTAQDAGNMWAGGQYDYDPAFAAGLLKDDVPLPDPIQSQQPPFASASPEENSGASGGFTTGELYPLGQFETLPPYEMIEELHAIYFRKQRELIPIIHQGRYLKSFYSSPHMRPPMALQYAVWTMASHMDKKYGSFHDIFYRRARRYLEEDELKGYGEHFLTVGHAQAWALISTNEARCMLFTRCSMSAARCVKLVMMLGLHRLDDESNRLMTPTIGPPQDWTELEERRRTLWGAFCIDSHNSISTGWPSTFDVNEITTRLPSSEEAFNSGREEKTSKLQEAFKGASYSVFAGSVLQCHLFNQILKHVHRPPPDDRPEDVEYGRFWTRHRELDTTLSNAFMYLPERFRVPPNHRNPIAVHTNLNLHASVICLHHAACDKADEYKLPPHVKKASLDRLVTAAQEIVNIMKLQAHVKSGYRSPLVALSLYVASSVYIYQASESTGPFQADNLEFLINCMEVIGQDHIITRSYLQQVIRDVKSNGLSMAFDTSKWENLPIAKATSYNIPLLARSSVSRHTKIRPPLPGRLPMNAAGCSGFGVGPGPAAEFARIIEEVDEDDDDSSHSRPEPKRKRMAGFAVETDRFAAMTPATTINGPLSPSSSRAGNSTFHGGVSGPKQQSSTASAPTPASSSHHAAAASSPAWTTFTERHLPRRTSRASPAVSSSTGGSGSAGYPTPGVYYASATGGEDTPGATSQQQPLPGQHYMNVFQGAFDDQQWNMMGSPQDGAVYAQFPLEDMQGDAVAFGTSGVDGDLWTVSGIPEGDGGEEWNGGSG